MNLVISLLTNKELNYSLITSRSGQVASQPLLPNSVYSYLPKTVYCYLPITALLTAALVDRLTHKAHLVNMNGESYRLRETKEMMKK